ncbi:hypothetical protein GQ473_05860 [archaeon]|nr:hypothetical protein [archaeon]
MENTTPSNPNKKKTLVLFDIGSVLASLDFDYFYAIGDCLSKTKGFQKRYESSVIDKIAMEGKLSETEYLEELKKLINPIDEISLDLIAYVYNLCCKTQIDEMVQLKKEISKAGYSVGILSNMNSTIHKHLLNNYPEMLETYDEKSPSIFSYEVGAIKPDNKIYESIKNFDKVIFIDDKQMYLKKGIDEFGWFGILFTPYIDLSETIRQIHSDKTQPTKNFKIANNMVELKIALNNFGVKVSAL